MVFINTGHETHHASHDYYSRIFLSCVIIGRDLGCSSLSWHAIAPAGRLPVAHVFINARACSPPVLLQASS